LGGGGNGTKSGAPAVNGTSGTVNTGGGGGGFYAGGGGSGVVIIRYPENYGAALTTGSPTLTTAGGYKIYTFTASGSITF
jgi:hypothetical protein